MIKNLFTLSLFVFLCAFLGAQEKAVLSGYMKDASNGETLLGASVYIKGTVLGTSTNEYGFYSIKLPVDNYNVEYSYLGFSTRIEKIELKEDRRLDIELGSDSELLEEIVIVAETEDENVQDIEMSVNKLPIEKIKSLPSLLGEVEIIRSIQLLPGVSSVGEGASGFNVRGGSIDQNLVLLDEAPIYNSSHLFGFFSVFNPDAVKDVKLYKGGIPSRYGGRLSSILDVRMKEGNARQLELNGGVGTIFSRFSVEAPIVKDKASFIVAGRRSYIDVLAKPFLNDDLGDTELNFYDLTLKTNYTINENNRIFLSGYFGRDNFTFGSAAGFNWGNSTGTLRWNHLFNERLFSNFTLYYSDYDYKIRFGDDSANEFDWNAQIENLSGKLDFNYFLNPQNQLRFGFQSIYYDFEPGNAKATSEGEFIDFSLPEKFALENALYIENEQDFSKKLTANYGLRASQFRYLGSGIAYTYEEGELGERKAVSGTETFEKGKTISEYTNLEPRISLKYQLSPSSSIKASYNRMTQYVHLVSNTAASTPVDVWTPSTNNIAPQLADQIAIGYFRNFNNNTYKFNIETYYKKMDNVVDYIDGADLLLNEQLEGDLIEGEGRAYGLEVLLEKAKGRFNGWMSYTLGRTERQIPGINGGEWYASRFDQTHNLSLVGIYELNDRVTFSSTFSLISGTPTTFPTSRYEVAGFTIPHNVGNERNNVRIPAYHRLDISATIKGKKHAEKRWDGEWVFGIYNLYSRKNPFSIYFQQQEDRPFPGEPINTEAIQLSVIGNFIPSVSYNFKFK